MASYDDRTWLGGTAISRSKVARRRLVLQGRVGDLAADTERLPGMRFVPFTRATMLEAATLRAAPA
ncbi:MAG: hypothetical protein ACYC3F_11405 [Gemmatimonadaceae bacterium]